MLNLDSVVVVGGGQAGAWAAKTLRDEGFAGRVTLIGEELHAPYERPKLSKEFLAGQCGPQALRVFTQATFDGLRLDWRKGVRATTIDRAARRVQLSDGDSVGYDRLILCTGGRPLIPPIRGIPSPKVHVLRTLDDSVRIAQGMQAAGTICVVGGGWIGLEIASTAARMGKKVHVVEREGRLCARVVPAAISQYLLDLHLRAGVEVHLGQAVSGIEDQQAGVRVCRADASPIDADIAVVGAGLHANDELAAAAGLRCERGILVDRRCSSSDPQIFAAGDVAVAPSRWTDGAIRLESWQNAQEQSVVAARNALGGEEEYQPLPWFWSDQHGVNIQMLGWPSAVHRTVVRPLSGTESFLCFLLAGDTVRGAVAINAPRELRMIRRLIESGRPVSEAELIDPAVKLSSL